MVLLGLAVGIAGCLVIFLYIRYENSYDRHFTKGDRIYRLVRERHFPTWVGRYAQVGHSWGSTLQEELPEIERFCRLFTFNSEGNFFRVGDQVFEEKQYLFVDSTFFELFDIELLHGDPLQVLSQPNTVVLTESAARKYFGEADPIGKTLQDPQYEEYSFVVTGLCRDVPENTHFDFEMVYSASTLQYLQQQTVYIQHNSYTYLLLRDGSSISDVEAKLPTLTDKYSAGQVERFFELPYEDYLKLGNAYHYLLQPLQDIHLHSHLGDELGQNGSHQLLDFLWLVAMLILMMACINYMNVATARAAERALEIGIRKTIGSGKGAIARQFLWEAILISVLGALAGVVLAGILLLPFNYLTAKSLSLFDLPAIPFLLSLLGLAVLVGLFSGSYPAVVLSSFKPIAVLQGRFSFAGSGRWFRPMLIVLQYIISVVLLICTMVVFQQQRYVIQRSLGFDLERLLILKGVQLESSRIRTFEEEMKKIGSVQCLSRASTHIGGFFYGLTIEAEGTREPIIANGLRVGNEFPECMGISILNGRSFSTAFNDSLSVVINQAAARALGLEDPVGKHLFVGFAPNRKRHEIIGLLSDFNYQSLYDQIKPLVLEPDLGRWSNHFAIRLQTTDLPAAIRDLEKVWQQFLPGYPFQYDFMDEDWRGFHRQGQISKGVFAFFTLLALIIICVGLLGLIQYMAQTRAKEIGIRKVFGAQPGNVLQLLSSHFIKLALVAMVIAFPLAWYFARLWLQNFAFHIQLSAWTFVLSGLTVVVITLLTVSLQAIKAATANPAEILRNE